MGAAHLRIALVGLATAAAVSSCGIEPERDNPLDPDSPFAAPGTVTGQVAFDFTTLALGDVHVTDVVVNVEGSPDVSPDTTGAFRVENVRPGRRAVEVRAPWHLTARIEGVEVRPGQVVALGEVPLARGRAQVAGIILVSGREAPVEGCPPGSESCGDHAGTRVNVADHPPGEPRFTLSNEEGAFHLLDVAAGTRRLTLSREGYDPALLELELQPGERHVLPAYTLGAGFSARVDGVVRLEDLDPPGADYAAVRVDLSGGVASVAASEDGTFLLSSPLGGTFSVIASRPGYERATAEGVKLAHDATVNLLELHGPLVLRPSRGSVKGAVSVNGADNDGVEVCVQGTAQCALSAVTPGETLGRFRIDGVRAGDTVQLIASKRAAGKDYVGISASHKVIADQTVDFGTVTLSFAGGDFRLVGRVLDPATGQLKPDVQYTRESWVAVDLAGVQTTGFGFVSRSFDGTFDTWLPLGTSSPDCADPANQNAGTALCVQLAAEGTQTLRLVLSEQAGGGGATIGPLEGSILFDASPPTQVKLTLNGGAAYVNATGGATVAAEVSAQDARTPLRFVKVAASTAPATPDPGSAAAQPYSTTPPAVNIPGFPSDGLRYVAVRVYDAAGNSTDALASITVDRTPPAGVTMALPDANALGYVRAGQVIVELDPGGNTDVYRVRLANDPGMAGQVSSAFVAGSGGKEQRLWTLAPGQGSRTVYAIFEDEAGNPSTQISATATVDSTAPAQPVLSLEENPCPPVQPTDTRPNGFTRNTTVCLDVTVDPSDFDHLVITGCAATTSTVTKLDCVLSPGDGLKTVSVAAVDPAGNVSASATAQLVLDTQAPQSPAPTLLRSPGAAPAAVTQVKYVNGLVVVYELAFDADAVDVQFEQTMPALPPGPWFAAAPAGIHVLGSTANGVHAVRARVRDLAGNESAWSPADEVVLDTQPPGTTAVSPSLPAFTNANPPAPASQLSTAEPNLWQFEVQGGACAEPCIIAPTGNQATHLFGLTPNPPSPDVLRVRARDLAGNVGPDAVYLVTHDDLPPGPPPLNVPGQPPIVNAGVHTVYAAGFPADPAAGSGANHFDRVEFTVTTGSSCAGVSGWQISGSPTAISFPLVQDATNLLCARAVDKAGNVSAVVGLVVVEDSQPPPPPVFVPGSSQPTVVNADSVFLWLFQQPSDPGNHLSHVEVLGGVFTDWARLPATYDPVTDRWSGAPSGALHDGRDFYEIPLLQDADSALAFRAVDLAGNTSTPSIPIVYRDQSAVAIGSPGDIRGAAIWGQRVVWTRTTGTDADVLTLTLGESTPESLVPGGSSTIGIDQISLWGSVVAFREAASSVRMQDLDNPIVGTLPQVTFASEPWLHGKYLAWIASPASSSCPAESGGSSRRVCTCEVNLAQSTGCAANTVVTRSNDSTRNESMPRMWGNRLIWSNAPAATTFGSIPAEIFTCTLTACAPTNVTTGTRLIKSVALGDGLASWIAAPTSYFEDGDVWTADFAATGAPQQRPNPAQVAWALGSAAWDRAFAWTDNRFGQNVVFRRDADWSSLTADKRASSDGLVERQLLGMSGHRVLYGESVPQGRQLWVYDSSSLRRLAWNGANRFEGVTAGGLYAWTDGRNGKRDIAILDRAAGREMVLDQPGNQEQPALARAGSLGVVVWRDTSLDPGGDIRGCRVGDCSSPTLLNSTSPVANQDSPGLWCSPTGNLCRSVWADGRSSSSIYAADFDPSQTSWSPVEYLVATGAVNPSVSSDLVVYQSSPSERIRMRYLGNTATHPAWPCRLSGGVECDVTTTSDALFPQVDGMRVVYQRFLGGEYAIGLYDISEGFSAAGAPLGDERLLQDFSTTSVRRPTLAGDRAFWLQAATSGTDVIAHELGSGASFRLTLGSLVTPSTDFDRPRSDGRTVVFTRAIGFSQDVVAWELP